MKPGECPVLDACQKVKVILDKDLESFQYMQCIYSVCSLCRREKEDSSAILHKGRLYPNGLMKR